MTSREVLVPRVVGTMTASIATATTTNLTSDIKLAPSATFQPNDRLVLVITGSTAGTTDSTSFDVQDAPDNAGSIGTPAAAVTTTLPAAATGNQYVTVGIRLQPGRPWIRVRTIRASGTTDTLVVRAVLLAVPHGF
jgi:hypothetical protein